MKGFLLDEHIPPDWRHALARRVAIEVWMVREPGAPFKGTPDFALLRWCEDNDFILVTEDRRTMPRHVEEHLERGGHVPGVLILRSDIRVGDLLKWLEIIAGACFPDELRDRILYLPPDF